MKYNVDESQPLLAKGRTSSFKIGFFFKKMTARICGDVFTAAEKGNIERLAKLIAYGADINKKDRFKHTALFYAILHRHLDCARLLLESGANPNIPCGNYSTGGFIAANQTALHLAVLGNKREAVELLLQYNADCTLRDSQGRTPKMIADQLYYHDLSQIFAIKEGIIATAPSESQGDVVWSGLNNTIRLECS